MRSVTTNYELGSAVNIDEQRRTFDCFVRGVEDPFDDSFHVASKILDDEIRRRFW
jgi:hypothetical protein